MDKRLNINFLQGDFKGNLVFPEAVTIVPLSSSERNQSKNIHSLLDECRVDC